MASPVPPGGRPVNPRDKAHFSLHISDLIVQQRGSLTRGLSSVKYNHKPSQTTSDRSTTLLPPASASSTAPYTLRVEDSTDDKRVDSYSFSGKRTDPTQSYILLLDPTTHTATLEPLESAYTFNLATKNGVNVSDTHPHIYPRRNHREGSHETAASDEGGDDSTLVDTLDNDDPDVSNPFDFRHFLKENKEKGGRGDESDYRIESSPDPVVPPPRTGALRRAPAEQVASRRPAAATSHPSSTQTAKVRKREADPFRKSTTAKATTKKPQPAGSTPTVRLDRRASTHTTPATSTKKSNSSSKKALSSMPSGAKKSADFVNSSDDDSDANPDVVSSPVHHSHRRASTASHSDGSHDHENENDDENENNSPVLTIEIEDPSASTSSSRTQLNKNSLSFFSSQLGRSPSAGPISLASATSAANTPEPSYRGFASGGDDVIDFGDFGNFGGGGEEDADGEVEEDEYEEGGGDVGMEDRDADGEGDVESVYLGTDLREAEREKERGETQGQAQSQAEAVGLGIDEDENDPLYKSMMEAMMASASEEESEAE